jgi:murein L,D-transpeptidase YafK
MPVILSAAKNLRSLDAARSARLFLPVLCPIAAVVVLAFLSIALAASQAQHRDTPADAKADRVLVLKHRHILQLLHNGKVVKQYMVALGGSPVGPKTEQGDHKTPEGTYVLDSRNAKSQFYKSLHISYPTPAQRTAARKRGVSPGGDVFIHGLPNAYRAVGAAHRLHDWTDGCIAVTDDEMDEIWLAVADETPIEIRP